MILGCLKNLEPKYILQVHGITDTGYQGIQKLHIKSELPKKKIKKTQDLARERVAHEKVIGMIKRFKIISDQYRNRRKRFGLRFNLIEAIYTMKLS
ncbi:hypothetical protein HCUR_00804 [Holospora curviuscula]|uniref:DDE Tnp4 domain-containing protein n=1 Tax=Holospora curviuscula TaxID=1082868 RepID=A0A2S5R8Y3_9PROT|nr:hypothetical protein HCUR_00804 [Holospora curviuscula]